MNPGREVPVLEEVEEVEAPPIRTTEDDGEGRAWLAAKSDAAWGRGDAAGHAWEAPSVPSEAWVPSINPWALHQSEAIAEWLRAKAADVANDIAELPERMRKAIAKRPEAREKLTRTREHYKASLQRQLAHIDHLRVLTGDTTALETKGHDVNDNASEQRPRARGPLLNQKKAADYLGFGVRKLQGLRNSPGGNKGPAYVLMGGSIFYDVGDLDAYVESQKVRSVA